MNIIAENLAKVHKEQVLFHLLYGLIEDKEQRKRSLIYGDTISYDLPFTTLKNYLADIATV